MVESDLVEDYRNSHISDEISHDYEYKIYSKNSYDSIIWNFEKKILAKYFYLLKDQNGIIDYMDFACGTGRIISYIESLSAINENLVGVDVSDSMLKIAESKLTHSKLINADLTVDDVLEMQKFDLITSFRFVLNAQPELRDLAIKLIHDKLKNNHSFLIFNVHGNKYSYRLITYVIARSLWGRRLNHLSYWETEKIVEKYNLKIVSFYGIGFVPKVLYRFFPSGILCHVDSLLQRIPFIKYLAYDLVFICQKQN
ncbi:methyltransferase domain-containing protein [Methanosarcina sp. KYL-1]|uniref:class I SAM-dependent DNA methyltransferase n=1 Tax=Methanosarcina sp. KYL-1 TaxID=2602068 RepID=UPI0021014656|nr:class I SAM-dependent methyltransferase [Methanosarcina sp. KYL-1]MCQ1536891.1 methyltransferase domain-containing protein [Methanosarcina sp. KYL-1]